MQVAGVVLLGDLEGVDGPSRADEQGLGPQTVVVHRAGGRGEVEHIVHRPDVEGLADVLFDKAETRLLRKMREIRRVAGAEVVDADNGVAFGEKRVSKVRSEKTGCSSNENGLRGHESLFIP